MIKDCVITLRPHHLIDIIRNIGLGRPMTPHPYGHSQHIVTRMIVDGTVKAIRLAVTPDDVCKSCIHLTDDGQCDDVMPQPEYPLKKQTYNDNLDQRLVALLDLDECTTITPADFTRLIQSRFDDVIPVCLHPGEDITRRREGLKKGLKILGGNEPA